jgi:peptide/nickel transport system ATP-binding protein
MTPPRLAIEALSAISLRDGDRPILRRVSLSVGVGEVHGVVGESGAGKSTIAKAILGIIPSQVRITGGTINFEGQNLLSMPANALRAVLGRDIALVPQDPSTALNPSRRIDAQLTDGLRLKRGLLGARSAPARSRCWKSADPRSGTRAQSYPHQLSGGIASAC